MFNAERLLGNLLTNALSGGLRRGLGGSRGGLKNVAGDFLSQNRAAIGMGLLGVSIAAYEHFAQKGRAPGGMGTPSQTSPVAPMPQTPGASPPIDWAPPPLPSSQKPQPRAVAQNETLLLIRAMIAAANADSAIDEAERQNILKKIEESGISAEERDFILNEFENPVELRSLVEQANSPQLAEQIYVVSLSAIQIDSEAERNYLSRLAKGLHLEEAVVSKWHQQLGRS